MKSIRGKILVKCDMRQKETHALTDKINIKIERGYNFNLREDRACYGYVIHGNDMKEGTPVIMHYLASEPSYEVGGDNYLTDTEREQGFKVRNVPVDMIFAYKENDTWVPLSGVLITKRLFKEYTGPLVGIEHERVKSALYVISGNDEWDGEITDLSGKVCIVTENSDPEIIWYSEQHKEEKLIRTLHREIVAVSDDLTEKVKKGELMVGYTPRDCVKLN